MRQFSRTTWVVGTGGLAILLVLGVLSYTSQKKVASEAGTLSLERNQILEQAIQKGLGDQDRDRDGLRDWEEGLWGADPDNPDTDNDGTRDGEEVDSNRNPTKAGPADELPAREVSKGVIADEPLSSTDVFARTFFSDYLTLRQTGQLQTQSGKDQMVAQLLATNEGGDFVKTNYDESDIFQSPVSSTEALRQYGNAVGNIITTFSIDNRNEAVVLLDALQNDDPTILDELIPIQEVYKNIHEEIQKLIVPKDAVRMHIDLLNGIATIENTIAMMRETFTDPLQTIAALKSYEENVTALHLAFSNAHSFFSGRGITFDQSEAGYLFADIVKNN